MNIKAAKEEIKNTLQAYHKKDEEGNYVFPLLRQRPILLMGPPGIGKTAIMEQVAHECGVGLVAYTITHHTRQSAIGLPLIRQRMFGGEEFDVTEYTMSEIIASVHECMERTGKAEGILFIDEINCASETLAPIMLQFLQNKTFGSHKVPEGWMIVAAGNPPEYNKSVREFDIVTLDRVRKVDIEADCDVWMEYAIQRQVHGAVLSFLGLKPENFYQVENTVDGKFFVTARGWEDLSEILKSYEEAEVPVTQNLIIQYLQKEEIARSFAVYYQLYCKYGTDYGIREILEGTWEEESGRDNWGRGTLGEGNSEKEGLREENLVAGNPREESLGEENPGERNPGKEGLREGNPGEGNPGEGNLGEGSLGEENPGSDNLGLESWRAEKVSMAKNGGFEERFMVVNLILDYLNHQFRAYTQTDERVGLLHQAILRLKKVLEMKAVKSGGAKEHAPKWNKWEENSSKETKREQNKQESTESGGNVLFSSMEDFIQEYRHSYDVKRQAGLFSVEEERNEAWVLKKLDKYLLTLKEKHCKDYVQGIDVLRKLFGEEVKARKVCAENVGKKIDRAFAFVEECYQDGQEMTLLVTGLTRNSRAVKYFSEHESISFLSKSKVLLFRQQEKKLLEECGEFLRNHSYL